MRPGIRAVHGYIDRNISDQLDTPLIGIGFQLVPLAVKLILQILLEFNIEVQLPAIIIHGIAPAQSDILRPPGPRCPVKTVLDCHEKSIIRKPPVIFGNKVPVILIFVDAAALIGFPKQRITAKIKLFIVDIPFFPAKIYRIAFFFGQNTFLDQCFQTDEVGIARKR